MKRYVSTSFWDDEWVQTLTFTEKGLYLYLLTNPLTNIAGVYKITNRRIAFDTGLEEKDVVEIMGKFSEAHKAFRHGEYLVFPTWPRHQNYQNTKIYMGIKKILSELDDKMISFLAEVGYRYPLEEFSFGKKTEVTEDGGQAEEKIGGNISDEQRLFMRLWQTTKDADGACIFQITATIERPRDWERYWRDSPPTAEQIETAFRNFTAGINSGAIQRRFIPATPDRFVLRGGITRYQLPVQTENGKNGKEAGNDMLVGKIEL